MCFVVFALINNDCLLCCSTCLNGSRLMCPSYNCSGGESSLVIATLMPLWNLLSCNPTWYCYPWWYWKLSYSSWHWWMFCPSTLPTRQWMQWKSTVLRRPMRCSYLYSKTSSTWHRWTVWQPIMFSYSNVFRLWVHDRRQVLPIRWKIKCFRFSARLLQLVRTSIKLSVSAFSTRWWDLVPLSLFIFITCSLKAYPIY